MESTMSLSPAPSSSRLDERLVTFVNRHSFEAEQFRRLRHRIEERGASEGRRVIAVTSAVARDGKTLTSLNLAGALAEGRGARILVIDADMRQPSVATRLGLEAGDRGGLLHVLEDGPETLADHLYRIDGSTLDVLPCERRRSATYESLTSAAFKALLARARAMYDYVIVDTPPVIPVPDGTLLRPVVDGYLLVVSANLTPRKLVAEALNLLEPTSVIGLVFNRDDRPLFGYYKSYYGQYFRSYAGALDRADA
jgi:receptor protein-tyrosine kinase